ncbi:MAG: thioredoxin domain-containing protein [Chlamydiae bacterium]|nr:thioredoxin domain-containing protein [Chlamydiota bacterium]
MSEAFTNRLIREKSPYLLRHAHNPVDWYPWGNEAFEQAKKEDRPIFLSIGYATCHWCHVMEQETFEDPKIAKMLNETFINVIVDREEHPEVDSIYMELAQVLMSSAGGWPLNVVLTPDLKPFFAITYLPPTSRKGLVGVDQFIKQIQALWKSDERVQLVSQANHLIELFEKTSKMSGEELPGEAELSSAIQILFELADPEYGGIKGEPKFPLGYQIDLFLQYSKDKNDSRSLFYVELTLDKMARGGICDHLGGGFARYTIDSKWHIPHFEKMLYDNALLAEAYLQAWKYTKDLKYRDVVRGILDYILREMTDAKGGFFSAQDADTEGREGLFYTWTEEEILRVIPGEDGQIFCRFFSVFPEGNFEGRNVFYNELSLTEFSKIIGAPEQLVKEKLKKTKETLFQRRQERVQPFKDDKIISSWNGLMIDAMAKAGVTFSEERYATAALKAASFIKNAMFKEGKLLRRYRDGEARFPGGLDDYAFMIKAIITLFEIRGEVEWLEWAIELSAILERKFKMEKGAFFQVEKESEIIVRKCEFYDGAEPSGNAVHAENLLRLYQITLQEKYLRQAEDILKAAKNFVETFPPGACYHLIALQRYLDVKAPTLIFSLDEKQSLKNEISLSLHSHFCPHAAIIWKNGLSGKLNELLPFIKEKNKIDGRTTLHICRQDRCESPLTAKEEILKAIETL